MNCIRVNCGGDTYVVRTLKFDNAVRRTRQCLRCERRFVTVETAMPHHEVELLRPDGTTSPFSIEVLKTDLQATFAPGTFLSLGSVLDEVVGSLPDESQLTTAELVLIVTKVLVTKSPLVALSYFSRHSKDDWKNAVAEFKALVDAPVPSAGVCSIGKDG